MAIDSTELLNYHRLVHAHTLEVSHSLKEGGLAASHLIAHDSTAAPVALLPFVDTDRAQSDRHLCVHTHYLALCPQLRPIALLSRTSMPDVLSSMASMASMSPAQLKGDTTKRDGAG